MFCLLILFDHVFALCVVFHQTKLFYFKKEASLFAYQIIPLRRKCIQLRVRDRNKWHRLIAQMRPVQLQYFLIPRLWS